MSRWIDAELLKRQILIPNSLLLKVIDSAPTIKTKQIKYYDDDEHVWKIGRVIVDETD